MTLVDVTDVTPADVDVLTRLLAIICLPTSMLDPAKRNVCIHSVLHARKSKVCSPKFMHASQVLHPLSHSGVAVRTDSTKLVTHGLALRWYHLWLPLAPLINFTVGQGG